MSIVNLNEAALYAAGFDRAFVETMRHIIRQVGNKVGAITLPQVTGSTDTLTPIVTGLTITITATNEAVSYLQANEVDLPPTLPHHGTERRMDDMQADLERAGIVIADLRRTLDDLQTDASLNTNLSALIQRIETLENGVL